MRSSATDVCAIVFVIFARSCTGLKNFDRYARNTVSAPAVIVAGDDQQRAAPQHEARAQRDDDRHDRREQRLDPARLERGVDRRAARRRHPAGLEVLPAERLDDAHRAQALLDDGDDVALPLAHLALHFLDRLLEAHHEQQQERRDADGDQREVPVEPEHEPQHADDRHQVDEDAERGRRREALHRRDVVGDRREQRAGLRAVVEGEREPVQMLVDADAQVVRDVLADALRVVVVDVASRSRR